MSASSTSVDAAELFILAGVDGSPSSKDAANYAAHLAQRRRQPLRLICAYQWPRHQLDKVPEPAIRAGLESKLRDEARRLQDEFPDLVDIHARLVNGHPAEVLIEQSKTAGITIVGCRGHAEFAELLLSSVSTEVAAHAHSPVIVVRPDDDHAAGRVLIGYDGSPSSVAALEFAAAEAARRKTTLIVVNVYDATNEQNNLASVAVAHTDLPVELRPIRGSDPAYELVSASHDAALTVVGSGGNGAFAGLQLGSVSSALIQHGHSPIAIIHVP